MPLSAALYPVGLVLAGRPCLVVGGGAVALRKAEGLLAAGARTTVVAPESLEQLRRLPLRLEARPYLRGEVAGYHLAVAATGRREIDRAVFEDGEATGVLVNSADDPEACSFVLPAVLRRGPLTVAVSTGGTSPALAGWLRDRIAAVVGEQEAELAGIVGSARQELRAGGTSSEGLPWSDLIGELATLLAAGRREEAARLARCFVAEAAAGQPASQQPAPRTPASPGG